MFESVYAADKWYAGMADAAFERGKVMRKMNVRTLVALVNSAGRLKLEPYTGQGRMKQAQSASPAASSSISALAWRRSDVSNPSMNRP